MRGRLVRGAVAVLAVLGGSIGAASAARERDSDRSVSGVRLAPAGAAEQRLCWANATRGHRPRARPAAGEGGGSAGRVGTSGGSAEEGWPTAAGVSGDGGAAGEGGETSDRGREGTGERGRLGASVAARRTVRGMVMVAVNVGSIAYGTPATGGAAGGGASGVPQQAASDAQHQSATEADECQRRGGPAASVPVGAVLDMPAAT